jgi:orotate phosphoribosyltransferase-like protein
MNADGPINRPSTPRRQKASDSTHDDRIRAVALRDAGFSYEQISQQTGLTQNQVQWAVQHRVTPKKRSGRHSSLSQDEIDEIIAWVSLSKRNRRVLWMKIPVMMGLNVSYHVVRTVLQNAGFRRRVARRKPPISE